MLRTKRNKRETTNRKDKGKGGLGEGLPQAKMEPDRGEKVAGKAENPGSHGRKMTVQSQNAGVFPMQDAGSGLHIAKKGGIQQRSTARCMKYYCRTFYNMLCPGYSEVL